MWTSKAYQMRLALRNTYNNVPYESWAHRRLTSWCNWGSKTAKKALHLLMKRMQKAVETIQSHWKGIFAY